MKQLRESQLKDTLFNCSKQCTMTEEHFHYAKGVLVGVMGTVMATMDMTFMEAAVYVKQFLPTDFDKNCVPKSWKNGFKSTMEKESDGLCEMCWERLIKKAIGIDVFRYDSNDDGSADTNTEEQIGMNTFHVCNKCFDKLMDSNLTMDTFQWSLTDM